MSHISTIKTEIKDLDALKAACESIGLQLNIGQKHYKSYGSPKGCLHAISVPNSKTAYEIGITEKNGVLALNFDAHAGGYGMMKLCGKNCEKITEAYTQTVAIKEASKFATAQGWSMSHELDQATGEVVIKLQKY